MMPFDRAQRPPPGELSGGCQQRDLARTQTARYLLDEPLPAVDVHTEEADVNFFILQL
jgi:ABC-type nitrate/sulfonate/bicarbonate transport system ATPase subunit